MIKFYEYEFGRRGNESDRIQMADLLNSLTEEQKEAIAAYGQYQYWEGFDKANEGRDAS